MISWVEFELNNPDKQDKFENMCRFLFKKNYCTEDTILQSNPNHPGIEVSPVKGKDGSFISFQSKYFIGQTGYKQIEDSCKQIVKHYEDKLDKVYLYCNKDINTSSKSYIRCVNILEAVSIKLIPITDQEILELANKDAIIRDAYFSLYTLDDEWFEEQVNIGLASLSNRFNNNFNVATDTEKSVSVFSENSKSIKNIKKRINTAIEKIENYSDQEGLMLLEYLHLELTNFLEKENFSLKDFQILTYNFKDSHNKELAQLQSDIYSLEEDASKEEDPKKKRRIYSEITPKRVVLEIVNSSLLNEFESSLINSKLLILEGENGEGKTQIFANTAKNSIEEGSPCILLLGYTFINNDSVEKQILQNLNIPDDDFSKFLNMLEGIGQNLDKPVIIYVDGIEETSYRHIWKLGIESVYHKLKKLEYVKFAFSFRSGFENQMYSRHIKESIDSGSISRLIHKGLINKESDGIKKFLDYYNIPFSPTYYFNHRMTNPLFLTLFCQTYDGKEMDIRQLFKKLIEKADSESKEDLDLHIPQNLLNKFLSEFVSISLNTSNWYVDEEDLLRMNFWELNGLNDKKLLYIHSLMASKILINNPTDMETRYYISYTLLRDYLIANYTYREAFDVKDLKESILKLLNIQEDEISFRTSMISAVIFTLDLYYEEYNEDLIFWLLEEVDKFSKFDAEQLAEEYIKSFTWKSNSNINKQNFIKVPQKYNIYVEIYFSVLIDNSTKEESPLNAEFLHDILYPMKISDRDFQWTPFINTLNEQNRLVQIILSTESGEINLNELSESQNRLLLILFGWFLTSSNRFLRDKSSKAMIEILKQNFNLSLPLLIRFEDVNDPYVIQRLYGIIYGASLKRVESFENEFRELCEYIYDDIFNSDEVYPDILLRDYARLIIERWIFENPTQNLFDKKVIKPPYNSSNIPELQDREYNYSKENGAAINRLYFSLDVNQGSYGDFGRYVFRSALEYFEGVDVYNCYLYAIDYIVNELGYSNRFSQVDGFYNNFNRHETKKIERIGKKYQWIAFYRILAKISDNYEFSNIYEDEEEQYNGPWNPYVRDFDPTLNNNFLIDSNAPKILSNIDVDFLDIVEPTKDRVLEWIREETDVFDLEKNDLLLTDNNEMEWVVLFQAQNYTRKEHDVSENNNKRQIIWRQSRAYFTKKDDYKNLSDEIDDKNFDGRWFPEGFSSIYTNFNREFYWAPSAIPYVEKEWRKYEVETEEYKLIEYEPNKLLLEILELDGSKTTIDHSAKAYKEYKKKKIAEVLPAYNTYLWEEQYDASQEEATSFEIPCSEIIDYFKLMQKEYDGYFYDRDTLVAYDTTLMKENHGLIIRKDYLQNFLNDKNYEVLWTVMGEKQFIHSVGDQKWSEWSGFISLNDEGSLDGKIELKNIN